MYLHCVYLKLAAIYAKVHTHTHMCAYSYTSLTIQMCVLSVYTEQSDEH